MSTATAEALPVTDRIWDSLEAALASDQFRPVRRILYATDGSESAGVVAELLNRLPLPVGSEIRVVTVAGADPNEPDWVLQAEDAHGKDVALSAMQSISRQGLTVTSAVRHGASAYEIIQAAKEFGAELVVLGSRGLTGVSAFLLGSVARNVAKHVGRPVLIARAPVHRLRRAVLALDESVHAAEAVRYACRLPLPEHTEVLVTTVVRPHLPYLNAETFYPTKLEELVAEVRFHQHQQAEKLLRRACARLHQCGKRVSSAVREGDPATEVLKLAREQEADLIIAGARGASLIQGLLVGSVADRILKTADCSVLLVH